MTQAYFVYNLSMLALFVVWAKGVFGNGSLVELKLDRHIALSAASIFLYAFVFGLRYKVGVDYDSYQQYYNELGPSVNSSDVPYEIGFYWLIRLLKALELPSASLFVVTCALQMLCMVVWLRRYSFLAPWFFYFFFTSLFILESLNGIRQALAFSIVLSAFPFVFERRVFAYLAMIGLAATVHTSALIFAALYFFVHRNIFPHVSIQVVLLVLAYVGAPVVKDILFDALPIIAALGGYEHYGEVQEDLYFGGSGDFGVGNIFAFVINLMIILASPWLKRKYAKFGFNAYYNLFFVGIVLQPGVYLTKYLLFARLIWYFSAFKFVVLSFFCAYLFSLRSRNAIGAALLGFLLMGVYYIWFMLAVSSGAANSAPYFFVFE